MENRGETKKKSRSIARRLNAELAWQDFLRGLLLSGLACVLILAGWCFVREGGFTPGVDRRFSGGISLPPSGKYTEAFLELPADAVVLAKNLILGEGAAYGNYFPFAGVTYTFSDARATHTYSAENILAFLCLGFCAFNLPELLRALIRSVTGSGVIRKYLRPLDEMAAKAEQLSEETHTTDRGNVRGELRQASVSEDVLGDVIDEIDDVEDSGAKLEFHQEELEGLESALNNMLTRLESEKKKQIRFVDDASHELRTPIAVIHGYADMLSRWGRTDPKVLDEAVEAIRVESEHMTTLIDQLLFLARGEMDRHVLDRQPVNAQALLDEIMVESEMLEEEKENRHVFRMLSSPSPGKDAPDKDAPASAAPDEALTVFADPAMLKQSVRILRDNAVKYTPSAPPMTGEVTFKAYSRREMVCIEVGDNGIGIPSSELPRIFDRFYRGSNARTDNAGGSGLGLSIAQWIVREHGGTIEAVSGTGIGTKMTIVLPRFQPPAPQP